MPEPIYITVKFDETLEKITEIKECRSMVSKDLPFTFFLHCILIDYPKIKKKYPPGVLVFSINGRAPETDSVLQDGDTVWFGVAK
jgi:hypothetical protein